VGAVALAVSFAIPLALTASLAGQLPPGIGGGLRQLDRFSAAKPGHRQRAGRCAGRLPDQHLGGR
jgi:hypothetical protein